MTRGARNLMILGVASAIVALGTTGVSLAIYHNSGDIYLDRSRPGYLPDKAEIEEEEIEEEYQFEKSGLITEKVIDEYLEKLEEEVKTIDVYARPYDESALSDEKLGISQE